MSNGLGTAFATLTFLAVLGGMAVLLGLTGLGALAFHRRTGRVPAALRYLAVAVLAGAVALAGFSVLAMYDEGPVSAALFLGTVLLPVAVAGGYLRRTTAPGWLDLLATTAMAWSLPFLLGVAAFFAVAVSVGTALGMAPSAPGRLGLARVGVVVAGGTVVAGTVLLGGRLARNWN